MYIYILRCEDNSLYTGIAADWKKRFEEHKARGTKCAKYTRSHPVVSVEAVWQTPTKPLALKAERFIKSFNKSQKEEFIINPQKICSLLMAEYEDFEIEVIN